MHPKAYTCSLSKVGLFVPLFDAVRAAQYDPLRKIRASLSLRRIINIISVINRLLTFSLFPFLLLYCQLVARIVSTWIYGDCSLY